MTKNPNYSPAQVALIVAAVAANGGIANLDVATALAANPEMDSPDTGPRKPRAITAKMSRMAESEGFTYQVKGKTTKDGKAIASKTALVERIAAQVGVTVEALSSLDNATKSALEVLADATNQEAIAA